MGQTIKGCFPESEATFSKKFLLIIILGYAFYAEPYHEQAEGNRWHNIADEFQPFSLLDHGETVMAEGGESGEASAKTSDPKKVLCLGQFACLVEITVKQTDNNSSHHIGHESA